ncbi:MAG: hypothetical protein ACK5MT_21120 [Actinomycetales bacterium]
MRTNGVYPVIEAWRLLESRRLEDGKLEVWGDTQPIDGASTETPLVAVRYNHEGRITGCLTLERAAGTHDSTFLMLYSAVRANQGLWQQGTSTEAFVEAALARLTH